MPAHPRGAHVSLRRFLALAGAVGLMIAPSACSRDHAVGAATVEGDGAARVLLDERWAIEVPEFGGAVPLGDSAILLWTRRRAEFALASPRGLLAREIPLPSAPIAVAATDSAGVFEMLDSAGRVYQLDLKGKLLSAREFPVVGQLVAGLRRTEGWWGVSVDPPIGLRLIRETGAGAGPPSTITPVMSDSVAWLWQQGMHLAEGPAGAVLLMAAEPFELTTLDKDGRVSGVLRLGESARLRPLLMPDQRPAADSFPPNWRTLPPLALDSLLLLTIADLNSDRRMLVLAHPVDGVRRVTVIDVPLGTVAIDRKSNVLAARRSDRLELIGYAWRWATLTDHTPR